MWPALSPNLVGVQSVAMGTCNARIAKADANVWQEYT
jgi:hypothetical protein